MLIGVDGNEANVKTRVGVSVYTLKLLEYFHQQSSPSLQFIIFLKNPPLNDLPLGNKNFSYQVVRGKFLWSQFFLPWFLLRNHFSSSKIDVFFSPAHYAPRFIFCPLVTTVHDLSYFYYPTEFLKKDLYQLKNWTGYSVKKSQKIICVSQSTKKDLQHYYHIPENKIQVIYNGFEKNIASPKTKINLNLPQQKYLLYVGTIQPRKNILTLVRAFGNFQTKYPDFKLVIVGKKGWLWQDIYQAINQVDYKEKIILTGFLDDYNLSILYSHAFCLVLPSFYEGFGIPVLEALSYKCPVICSSTSSLPEVAGEAALYFDPHNELELEEKLLLLNTDLKVREKLINQGKERIKYFSWEKCGKETLNLLKKVYAKSHF